MKYLIILPAFILMSCNWAKQKAKDTVHKTGEVVAKTGAEFADGVAKGVEKTFQNTVQFSEQLQQAGLKSGKIIISSSDSATDNIVVAYLIFDKDFDQSIMIKVLNENGLEYGRVYQKIAGKKGEARYFDFVFDKRTNIDSKGTLSFE